jgi:hypothetical protein
MSKYSLAVTENITQETIFVRIANVKGAGKNLVNN